MKKYFSLIVILLITYGGLAQREIVKELEPFTEIKAFDRIKTVLIKSNENKIVITGEDQDDAEISIKNGLLKIKMEFENQIDGGDVTAKVYYMQSLTLIDANEGAVITSEDTFSDPDMNVAAQEGGKITLNIDTDNIYVKSTSGAAVTLKGKAKVQEAIANAGGKIHNKELLTTETKVQVFAGGSANVHATEKMAAKVKAGGSIFIYGNPKDLKRDKVFGGKIKLMD